MGWEDMPDSHKRAFLPPLKDNEVSLVETKVKGYKGFRLHIRKSTLPANVEFVQIKLDKKRGRVGIFVAGCEDGKKINNYSKISKIAYISCPKPPLDAIGFKKGRYKRCVKSKDKDMLFYISINRKIS